MKNKTNRLKNFFNPKSVAVIGASNSKGKVGNTVIANLKETYQGKIYPINLKDEEIEGLEAYKSITDVTGKVDLAIIAIPAQFVIGAVKECNRKGCKNIIIISAGFQEAGPEGIKLQTKLFQLQQKLKLNILGPNCLGYIFNPLPINASFASGTTKNGNIAFLSQSGAMGIAGLEIFRARSLGMGSFVSIGNKMDINEIDLINHFGIDKKTKVIMAYLEDIKDGLRFIKVAREVAKKKPIIILKSGKSEAGKMAASSHTGSLAGASEAYRAAFNQAGIIEASGVESFFNLAEGFSLQELPRGNRVAIVTNAGGPGIILTDKLSQYNLKIAELSEYTKSYLKKKLVQAASVHNPVDVLGDATVKHYSDAVQAVVDDKNVDAVIVVLTHQDMTDVPGIAKAVGKISRQTKKTVMLCFIGGKEITNYCDTFKKYSLPHFLFPNQVAMVLGQMWKYYQGRSLLKKDKKIKVVKRRIGSKGVVTEDLARKLMNNFPLHRAEFIQNEQEAIVVGKKIGYPLALKIVSPKIIHKSDIGGVIIDIKDEKELISALVKMRNKISKKIGSKNIKGYLVGEMVKGFEMIIGMKRDPQFGPLIMIGAGGINVEIFKDVSFGVAPLNELTARKMINELKIIKILNGYRGSQKLDTDSIVDLLIKLSHFALGYDEIDEIDFNPVIVRPRGNGSVIIDVRISRKI